MRRTEGPATQDLQGVAFDLEGTSAAPPEAVYATLADLRSHLVWGGRRQQRKFRLLSMEAPPGPAGVGTEFRSSGVVPLGSFADHSVVTAAEPGRVFEFRTEAVMRVGRHEGTDRILHRYEIAPEGRGSRVTYAYRGTGPQPTPARMRMMMATPGLRGMMLARVRQLLGRGFANLLRMAEGRLEP